MCEIDKRCPTLSTAPISIGWKSKQKVDFISGYRSRKVVLFMTVADVLMLPSMIGSKVIAGKKGLSNLVGSVNVIEYGYVDETQYKFFQENQFYGNELYITSFATICDDTDAQCLNIYRYHKTGAVALVLYYVGIVMQEIDQKVIDLCNKLDFVLICMPKNQFKMKYDELIREIMYELFCEGQKEHFFISTLLERMSTLPTHLRNMRTLLTMLSEHMQASVILCEQQKPNIIISQPRFHDVIIANKITTWLRELNNNSSLEVCIGNNVAYLQNCPNLLNLEGLTLYTIHYKTPVPYEMLWQASECVRLFINIWDEDYGKFVISELVRSIINDEPIKKTYLSKLFHVDVESLNEMWLLIPRDNKLRRNLQLLNYLVDYFYAYSKTVLASFCDESLVIFIHATNSMCISDLIDSDEHMKRISDLYEIVRCSHLKNTSDARNAYFDAMATWRDARIIFPSLPILDSANISVALICHMIAKDKNLKEYYMHILANIESVSASASTDLLKTLSVYMLDTSQSIVETSKKLYVHLNTVKHRLRKINDLTGFSPLQFPDAQTLYLAAALHRLTS